MSLGQITQCRCAGPAEDRSLPDTSGLILPHCSFSCEDAEVRYALFDADDKVFYDLDNQKKAKAFTGQYVTIIGALNKATGTITVDRVARVLPRRIAQAKSIYIDCDTCAREMAKALPAANEVLGEWNHFGIVADPTKADLIFLFSANPYLGDYRTRQGPDKRPSKVNVTYMNVVDARTGQSLWGDSRAWGSLLVAKATRSLIAEFRLRVEEENQSDPQSSTAK
jgi:hypothetical protein